MRNSLILAWMYGQITFELAVRFTKWTYRLARRHPWYTSSVLGLISMSCAPQWYSTDVWTTTTTRWLGVWMFITTLAVAYPVFRFCDWLDARHKQELRRTYAATR